MNEQYSLDEQMILAFYGELSDAEKVEFEKTIAMNTAIAEQYRVFQESMMHVKRHQEPQVNEEFFTALEYNIHASIRREKQLQVPLANTKTSWVDSLKEMFLTPQRIGFVLAGGLASLLIGLFIGTKLPSGEQQTIASGVDSSQVTILPASSQKVTDFLRRSQIYLVTSVDKEVKCDKCIPIQQQYNNKKIAEDLLKEAAQLREHAKSNPEMQKLLGDLEFVLYNISTNQASANPAQAEVIHRVASNAVCETSEKLDSVKVSQSK